MLRQCFILVGPIQSGKTFLLNQILEKVRKDYACFGFTEECLYKEKSKDRIGYDLHLDLNGEKSRFPFVRIKERISIGDPNLFDFDKATIEKVGNIFKSKIDIKNPSLLYFDEYGRIESRGRGLFPAIKSIITQANEQNAKYTTIFSIREQNLPFLMKNLKNDFMISSTPKNLNLPCQEDKRKQFINEIHQSLQH